MKFIKNLALIASCIIAAGVSCSCNKFLDIAPRNLQTEETALKSYNNFRTFSWKFYEMFGGASDIYTDAESPWVSNNGNTTNNVWAYQKVTEATGNSFWKFDYIRRINIMLRNIDQSEMSDSDKSHWRSVGLFFRAYNYFGLVSKYGDVPWLEDVVEEDDDEIIFGTRTDRDIVAQNIIRDLQYAEEHIKIDGDGPNTINQNVVRALISRFALFEGTWRKYHGLTDADSYLNICVETSKKLMDAIPEIHGDYEALFNQEDLNGMTGIILYKEYTQNVLTHRTNRNQRASANTYELSKQMVDKYLCTDGRPISTSSVFDGDKTPYDEFRNRDYRFLYTVVPPSRVYKANAASMEWRFLRAGEQVRIGTQTHTVTPQDSATFREYINLMARISSPTGKQFPLIAWNNTLATTYTPRFRSYPEGIAPFSGQHGYWIYKHYNTDPVTQAENSQDVPLFRIEETMLNYAEALAELGRFTQQDADLTINKLRARVNVAPMVVAMVDHNFDTERDADVNPVLWEIRRERTVELLCEGFAFDDIRRWKKGNYLDQQLTGAWVKNAHYNNVLRIHGYPSVAASKDKEGYVVYLAEPLGWKDHYYLYPIPMEDLVLNPQLEQNPGYQTPN